ncbi:MAG TPA: YcxB family protein [Telluria sp.]
METLSVSTDLSRRDLIVVSLHLLPRLRGNWVFMGILAAGTFAYLLYGMDEVSAVLLIAAVLASAAAAIVGLLSGFLINLICGLLTVGKNSGVLGRHDLSISPTGFVERTVVNQSQHSWDGIKSVMELGNYLVIIFNGYLIHIVPRRSFDSADGFDSFATQAKAWHDQAHAKLQSQQT